MSRLLSVLTSGVSAFNRWVCDPVDPRPLALFRSWFGLLCLVNLCLLWPDMPMWLANDGVLPPGTHAGMVGGTRFSLYLFTGYSDAAIFTLRLLGVLGGLGLLLGFFPRVAAFCVWFVMASVAWRNPAILHSGDNLIRIGAFFLMFARTDTVCSLSGLLRRKILTARDGVVEGHGPMVPAAGPQLIPAWPQRILQLQLCVVYLVTGIWKAKGLPWKNGTAVGTVLQLGEFQRFPIPDFFMTPLMSEVMTYSTLVVELGFPFLIWIPRLRVPVLLSGLALHAGLDWVMNVQLFQWTITSYYLLFLRFDDKGTSSGVIR